MTKKQLFDKVIDYFQREMPIAETELKYDNPYQLLVAVILSAQCTDVRVNKITPEFFNHFPTAEILKYAKPEEVYQLIKSCSYPNNKAKHLVGMAKMLVDEFNSVVPDDVKELQKLPGVGRKTANVIASVVYKKSVIAVDTHVFRVSNRLGLTDNAKTPLQVEQQLEKYFPKELLPIAHHWLILHGRYTCTARNPKCAKCGLRDICKFFNNNVKK